MSYKFLLTRRDGPVEYLTLNRPDVRNAFNAEMIAELASWAADTARKQGDVRAVVIGGAGKVFCAGADASWLATIAAQSQEENIRDATVTSQMFRALAFYLVEEKKAEKLKSEKLNFNGRRAEALST